MHIHISVLNLCSCVQYLSSHLVSTQSIRIILFFYLFSIKFSIFQIYIGYKVRTEKHIYNSRLLEKQ